MILPIGKVFSGVVVAEMKRFVDIFKILYTDGADVA
jgi:hypothetical protein